MNPYRLVIQVQVIWILRMGVVQCEISSYRAGYVDWDFLIGKPFDIHTHISIMIGYRIYFDLLHNFRLKHFLF
jgi:hypothetical protein